MSRRVLFLVDLDNLLHYASKGLRAQALPCVGRGPRLVADQESTPPLEGATTWHCDLFANTATLARVGALAAVDRAWVNRFAASQAQALLADAGRGTLALHITLPVPQSADQALCRAIHHSATASASGRFDSVFVCTGDAGLLAEVAYALDCRPHRFPERPRWPRGQRLWWAQFSRPTERAPAPPPPPHPPVADGVLRTLELATEDPSAWPGRLADLARAADAFPAWLTTLGGAHHGPAVHRLQTWPELHGSCADALLPGSISSFQGAITTTDSARSFPGAVFATEPTWALARTECPQWLVDHACSLQPPTLRCDTEQSLRRCRLDDAELLDRLAEGRLDRPSRPTVLSYYQDRRTLKSKGAWWVERAHGDGSARARSSQQVTVAAGVPGQRLLSSAESAIADVPPTTPTHNGGHELVMMAPSGRGRTQGPQRAMSFGTAYLDDGRPVAFYTLHALRAGQAVHLVPLQRVPLEVVSLPAPIRRLPIALAVSDRRGRSVSTDTESP